ncbi:cytochrome P450 [Isoptericola sp. NEAU-Y5]|uniref:Cytochrome P450 n=1 Tax=Isoptericola luteus TaxID=2879484 RepID=A0ABS7ZJJ1_9MICO|nr:cytochrome P450 [Isoptericola sp. NEAU-Y5]MCA5893989.1 cytochrome P450 [Isoptericola sp. NEAU-Y5]
MSRAPVDLTAAEVTRVVRAVLVPLVAQGAIVRRPRMTAWAERRQSDREVRRVLTALRDRYDGAPLALRAGTRRLAVVTTADDVRRLLEGTPEPFSAATKEKRGALAHFQPRGVLVSDRDGRRRRRPLNEEALDAGHAVHEDATAFVAAVERAAGELERTVQAARGLDAGAFLRVWWRLVLEVTFGEDAREDRRLVGVLSALRRDGNWSWFRPRRPWLLAELERRVARHTASAPPTSLAGRARDADPDEAPGQVPHWLFAFDAAGATTLRALAVAAARPRVRDRLVDELGASGGPGEGTVALLPYGRACVLEAVRLWPTTLAVLRDSTRETRWGDVTVPPGTGFVVVSSFFHRDPARLEHADGFAPEAWLDGRADDDWSLVPFSGGPASCPGRNVVLLVASHLLARLAGLGLAVERGQHLAADPLPCTVDHLGLRFVVRTAAAIVGGDRPGYGGTGPGSARPPRRGGLR